MVVMAAPSLAAAVLQQLTMPLLHAYTSTGREQTAAKNQNFASTPDTLCMELVPCMPQASAAPAGVGPPQAPLQLAWPVGLIAAAAAGPAT